LENSSRRSKFRVPGQVPGPELGTLLIPAKLWVVIKSLETREQSVGDTMEHVAFVVSFKLKTP
jgi:hypothetical protein